MSKLIIFLNGPAGSGKDTIGRFLVDKFSKAGLYKFAEPLKRAVGSFFSLNEEEYSYYFETQQGKATVGPRFYNKTPREWLIGFSELYAKTLGGKDVFGKLCAKKIETNFNNGTHEVAIITDSGFVEEAKAVVDSFKGEDVDFLVVRLERDGLSFSGDSRGYFDLTGLCVNIKNKEGDAVS